ncbi:MAG: Lrp/AsnC family transcriptional regulator [Formosimonas sp.]
MHTIDLDKYDIRLLQALQTDAQFTHVELAERVHLSASQCQRRIKNLEHLGIINGYFLRINPNKLGLNVMATVQVSIEKQGKFPEAEFKELMDNAEQVLECYSMMGDYDYLLKVIAHDLQGLNTFIMQLLSSDMVARVRSNVLLNCLKDTSALPLPKPSQTHI